MLRLLLGLTLMASLTALTVLGWGLGPKVEWGWSEHQLVSLDEPTPQEDSARLRVVVMASSSPDPLARMSHALLWQPDLLIVLDAPALVPSSGVASTVDEEVAVRGELTWRAFLPRINRRLLLGQSPSGWSLSPRVSGLWVFSARPLVTVDQEVHLGLGERAISELLYEPAAASAKVRLIAEDEAWTIAISAGIELGDTGADLAISGAGDSLAFSLDDSVDLLQERAELAGATGEPWPGLFLELERR